MKKIILGLLLVLVVVFTASASEVPSEEAEEWTTMVTVNEMTGEETWYALSPRIEPVSGVTWLESPFHRARIVVANNGEEEWAYFHFATGPVVPGAVFKILSGYSIITTRIKWDDDDPEIVQFTKKTGSNILRFRDQCSNIAKIESKEIVLLELDRYFKKSFDEGKIYYRFSLAGSTNAINEIREAHQ